MNKRALYLIGFISVIGVSLFTHYSVWNNTAKQFSDDFKMIRHNYEGKVTGPIMKEPSVAEIKSAYDFILSTIKKIDGLGEQLDVILLDKVGLRKNSSSPEASPSDVSDFEKNIFIDLDRLPNPLESGLANESASYETALGTQTDLTTIVDISRKYLNTVKIAKILKTQLASIPMTEKEDSYKAIEKNIARDLKRYEKLNDALRLTLERQKSARQKFKFSINKMNDANKSLQQLGNFAESSSILQTYRSWDRACNGFAEAIYMVSSVPGVKGKREKRVAGNLLKTEKKNMGLALSKAQSHRDLVYAKYQQAKREESTVLGQVTRSSGRFGASLLKMGRDAFSTASETRIGKEIGMATKTMVLGTKIFFDFITMDPNQDVLSWATSYESDFDQLMDDYDEIHDMDEASLTGENTFVEDWINSAYSKSFDK